MEQKYELYHHGILGMKWGVRRFQNEDGSYTKRGLERYRNSKENYDKVKSDYKAGKATRSDLRASKKELSKNYDYLKKDYRADKGRKLYYNGKTISGTRRKAMLEGAGLALAGGTAFSALKSYALSHTDNYRNFKLAEMGGYAVLGASALAAIGLTVKNQIDSRNLRAYYTHSSPERSRKRSTDG